MSDFALFDESFAVSIHNFCIHDGSTPRPAIRPRDGPIRMAEYDVLEVAQTSCASHYDVAISCAICQSTVDIGN